MQPCCAKIIPAAATALAACMRMHASPWLSRHRSVRFGLLGAALLQRHDAQGQVLARWHVRYPVGIAVDCNAAGAAAGAGSGSGTVVYVASMDPSTHAGIVLTLDPTGAHRGGWTTHGKPLQAALSWNEQVLYVVESDAAGEQGSMVLYNATDGVPLRSWPLPGMPMAYAPYIAVADADGAVFVTDAGRNLVRKYSSSGELLALFDEVPDGALFVAVGGGGSEVTSLDRVYVCEYLQRSLSVWSRWGGLAGLAGGRSRSRDGTSGILAFRRTR